MKRGNYISLFTGAGGLDIGLERSGLEPLSLCEIDPIFCDTLQTNAGIKKADGKAYLDSARIVNGDIRDLSGSELSGGKEVDLVVGGPSCQSFSSAGNQRSVLDTRGELIHEFYRIINEISPKVFLFENVRGIVTARDKEGKPGGVIKEYVQSFENLGYSTRAALLNSADYGAYQRRVRCFILGTKYGEAPHFPDPTHQKKKSIFHQEWNSLEDFLIENGDMQEDNYVFPTAELYEKLKDIPNGSGLKSNGKAEKTRPGGHWGYRQGTFIADLNLPARTVTGSSSQDWVRWKGNLRRLTLNEIKLLQGFPIDWEVKGTKAQVFKQIGNAVPTIFGELIGNTIIDFLSSSISSPPKFLGLPKSFKGYIDYTIKDHERNKDSREIHKHFGS
jgi:DNA (cytosine-5)-methyltransferase 1